MQTVATETVVAKNSTGWRISHQVKLCESPRAMLIVRHVLLSCRESCRVFCSLVSSCSGD
jgi:hypothetical protein